MENLEKQNSTYFSHNSGLDIGYESFELKKQPEHNLWSSCMGSIMVENG